jgi:hypothetical protein
MLVTGTKTGIVIRVSNIRAYRLVLLVAVCVKAPESIELLLLLLLLLLRLVVPLEGIELLLLRLLIVRLRGRGWRCRGSVEVKQVHGFRGGSGRCRGRRRGRLPRRRGGRAAAVSVSMAVPMVVVVVTMAGATAAAAARIATSWGWCTSSLRGGGRRRRGHGRCDVLLQLVFIAYEPLNCPHRVRFLGLLESPGKVCLVVGVHPGISPLLHELHAKRE